MKLVCLNKDQIISSFDEPQRIFFCILMSLWGGGGGAFEWQGLGKGLGFINPPMHLDLH